VKERALIPGDLWPCISEEGRLPVWRGGEEAAEDSRGHSTLACRGKGRTGVQCTHGMTQRGMRQQTRQLAFAWGEGGESPGDPGKGSLPPLALDREGALTGELMEAIAAVENLRRVMQRVRANRGSPGVDAMSVEQLPAYLDGHGPQLREMLLAGTYQPLPVKRVAIPKRSGGTRELGIPTVVDRLVQQTISQVLTPLYDPTFSPHSYGFRPGKSAHQALEQARAYVAEGKEWIVDLDLERFFDHVNHAIVMGRLAGRRPGQRGSWVP